MLSRIPSSRSKRKVCGCFGRRNQSLCCRRKVFVGTGRSRRNRDGLFGSKNCWSWRIRSRSRTQESVSQERSRTRSNRRIFCPGCNIQRLDTSESNCESLRARCMGRRDPEAHIRSRCPRNTMRNVDSNSFRYLNSNRSPNTRKVASG